MSAPDFNKAIWNLNGHKGDWAILVSKKNPSEACLIQYVDGDWELNDSGDFGSMRAKFVRVTGIEGEEHAVVTLQAGMGHDSFDKAFPHAEWEQLDAFTTKNDIDYTLWRKRGIRGPNPPAFSSSAFLDPDGELCWQEVHRGNLWQVQESWERAKANLAYVAPPKVNEYAAHPNFGRF
ncbi:hypothetical protein HJA82_29615 [Rhizobium bangladeshense]|uniref:hypothetical protein n=1 Tax=Rhizobium bangladeshense TaxID=1138189 RepID=UPI001C836999|nr:hypothetical protein [Rhizobium bangladeshense]MBX4911475.1 hypothetical protein [Rhizobium bangladeshense]